MTHGTAEIQMKEVLLENPEIKNKRQGAVEI